MMLFQIIFFGLLIFELLIAYAVKFNYRGFKNKLISWFKDNDVEEYINSEFTDKWIYQILFMILLLVLCVC